MDGTGVDDQFITGLAIPRSPAFKTADPCGIAVAEKYIYWTNAAEGGKTEPIGRANIDGTGVNKRFITGVPNGFCAIAVAGGHIYWTNGRFLGRANLDGTGLNRRFIPTPGGACGVARRQDAADRLAPAPAARADTRAPRSLRRSARARPAPAAERQRGDHARGAL